MCAPRFGCVHGCSREWRGKERSGCLTSAGTNHAFWPIGPVERRGAPRCPDHYPEGAGLTLATFILCAGAGTRAADAILPTLALTCRTAYRTDIPADGAAPLLVTSAVAQGEALQITTVNGRAVKIISHADVPGGKRDSVKDADDLALASAAIPTCSAGAATGAGPKRPSRWTCGTAA